MKILVINPNSSAAMTDDIKKAAQFFAGDRMDVVTVSTPGAPEFIDTFEDAALAAPGMVRLVRQWESEADAVIVACACDPNLELLREICRKPVIGIGEASMRMAVMLGNSFSILQTDSYSIPNKRNLVRKYGMDQYLASIRTAEFLQGNQYERYLEAGKRAISEDGAEVLILGCAGLCNLADRLSKELKVPVLDGVVCGLSVAEGMARLGYQTSKKRYYSGGKPAK
jgi:allantoin racemase